MKLCTHLLFSLADIENPSNWIFSLGKSKGNGSLAIAFPIWPLSTSSLFSRDLRLLAPFKLDTHLRKPQVSTFSVSVMASQHVRKARDTGYPGWEGTVLDKKNMPTDSPEIQSSIHPSIHPLAHLFFHSTLPIQHSTCLRHSVNLSWAACKGSATQ